MSQSELALGIHRRRVRQILWVSAGLLMALGAGWALFSA